MATSLQASRTVHQSTKLSTQAITALPVRYTAQSKGAAYSSGQSRRRVASSTQSAWLPSISIGKQRKQVHSKSCSDRGFGQSAWQYLQPSLLGACCRSAFCAHVDADCAVSDVASACMLQGNNSLLNWARTTRMACQLAPAQAPAGQDIATFAGTCSAACGHYLADVHELQQGSCTMYPQLCALLIL